jgi:hypothetical protein
MSEVRKILQIKQIHERQGIRLSPEEGEAVVKFSERMTDLMTRLRGSMAFDSEPAGYSRTLSTLKEKK